MPATWIGLSMPSLLLSQMRQIRRQAAFSRGQTQPMRSLSQLRQNIVPEAHGVKASTGLSQLRQASVQSTLRCKPPLPAHGSALSQMRQDRFASSTVMCQKNLTTRQGNTYSIRLNPNPQRDLILQKIAGIADYAFPAIPCTTRGACSRQQEPPRGSPPDQAGCGYPDPVARWRHRFSAWQQTQSQPWVSPRRLQEYV